MTFKRMLASVGCGLWFLLLTLPVFGQGSRGKAELKAGSSAIAVDYGRPALKGRDMLSQLQVQDYWRMGTNEATVLTTPVALTFGTVKVAKGSYSLWLKKTATDKYELVFNSETGQWGTEHDAKKDLHSVALKKEAIATPVELFTIELKPSVKGGEFSLSWGTAKLVSEFEIAK